MNDESILASYDLHPFFKVVRVKWVWLVKPAAAGFAVQGGPPAQIPNLMKITISNPAPGSWRFFS
jgi:hypothetical protein